MNTTHIAHADEYHEETLAGTVIDNARVSQEHMPPQISSTNMFFLLIIFAAFVGFVLAFYIRTKKVFNKALVCPLRGECDVVVHSAHGTFLGFPVELLGMCYYGIIAISYGAVFLVPSLATITSTFFLLVVTASAFLFSLYLTFIQAFVLKRWCTWCLISAGLCTSIFIFTFTLSSHGLIAMLAAHHTLILIAHAIGFSLGLGGATISDIFFFKFLKDLRISEWEASVLHTLSQIIWGALALIIISGIGLSLPEMGKLHASSKFLVKMVVVAVVIMNGTALGLFIAPKLVKISFGKRHHHETGELHRVRRLAFALGGISLTSWYTTFILGMLKTVPLSFLQLLSIYIGLLLIAIIGSQFVERYFKTRSL